MVATPDVKPLIAESSISESSRVDVVLGDFREGTILIPDYQRDSDQWDETTKSLLIESVINNLSVPAFFFEVAVDAQGIERAQVIDGQQRLTTLAQFYDKRFRLVDASEAPYISPNSIHYAGRTFDELPLVYQQSFKKYRLSVIKLRDLKDMRLEVFRRINQGGTPLSGQDIRLAYYGEHSPSLAFIRLVGIYDRERQAAQRFMSTASLRYGIADPWVDPRAFDSWSDLWKDKDLARGQTASEMFLWALMAAEHAELDAILQNSEALRKLNVPFNREIDGAMDVYCAQLRFQDTRSDLPPALITFDQIRTGFFPLFQTWIGKLGIMGPSLDVRKYRTIASLVGASWRERVPVETWDSDRWGRAVEFIRGPMAMATALGVEWPQSKGRWDGAKGYRAQMTAACEVVRRLAA